MYQILFLTSSWITLYYLLNFVSGSVRSISWICNFIKVYGIDSRNRQLIGVYDADGDAARPSQELLRMRSRSFHAATALNPLQRSKKLPHLSLARSAAYSDADVDNGVSLRSAGGARLLQPLIAQVPVPSNFLRVIDQRFLVKN